MIGAAIELPDSPDDDLTEFGWVLNDDALTYTGFSAYFDTTEQTTTQDNNWLCDSEESGDSENVQGFCYNFMLTAGGSGADYRFSTNDLINVYGWTSIGGQMNIFSLSKNTVLMGAFSAGASIAAIAAATLSTAFWLNYKFLYSNFSQFNFIQIIS